ncbi:MAG: hypothetical protein ACRDUV_13430 [Pseudonocardiaceae bacterium]
MADFDSARITPDIAGQVLWYYGEVSGARRPGSFASALLAAIAAADPGNQARLALGFPGYVVAVQTIQRPDGVEELRDIAEGVRTVSTGGEEDQ